MAGKPSITIPSTRGGINVDRLPEYVEISCDGRLILIPKEDVLSLIRALKPIADEIQERNSL